MKKIKMSLEVKKGLEIQTEINNKYHRLFLKKWNDKNKEMIEHAKKTKLDYYKKIDISNEFHELNNEILEKYKPALKNHCFTLEKMLVLLFSEFNSIELLPYYEYQRREKLVVNKTNTYHMTNT